MPNLAIFKQSDLDQHQNLISSSCANALPLNHLSLKFRYVRYVVSSRDSREKQTNRQSRKQQWSHTSGFLAQKIKVIKRDILSKSVGALCHHVDEKVEINFLAHNHTWLQFAQRLLLPSLLLLILLSSFSDQLLILVTFFPALFCCSPCCNQSPNRREMKWEWEQLIKYSYFHLSSLE